MVKTMKHPQRCETCKNEACEYYNYRSIYYGVYDDDADKPLALTPATFTGERGCASYMKHPEMKWSCSGCLAESLVTCDECVNGSKCVQHY